MSKQLLKLSAETERALTGLALGLTAAPAAQFTIEKAPVPTAPAPRGPNGPV
jgi:hypothetical protein